MFGKKRTFTHTESIVGPNSRISGDIHFLGHCHINGVVRGSVTADPDTDSLVTIRDSARVDGGVTVPNVMLNGVVKGDVYASQRVELGPSARVIGNVYYNLIKMAEGAEINGKLVHQPEGQVPLLEQTTRIDQQAASANE